MRGRPDVDAMNANMEELWHRLFWVYGGLGGILVGTFLAYVSVLCGLIIYVPAILFFVYRCALWIACARRQKKLAKAVELRTQQLLTR